MIDISRDKKDNAYLNLCLKARADFLLTGDKDLLEISPKKLKSSGLNRLKIVSPDTFLSEPKKNGYRRSPDRNCVSFSSWKL